MTTLFLREICASWVRIHITRFGGSTTGGEVEEVEFSRYSNQNNVFYDVSVFPNVEYNYVISLELAYMNPVGGAWVTCPSDLIMNGTITADAPLPSLTSFRGANSDNRHINYFWEAPQDQSVQQYRLRALENNNYVEKVVKDANEDRFFSYEHPSSNRGKR